MATPPADPFRSARLLYRAVETPQDDDFIFDLYSDPLYFMSSNGEVGKPQSRAQAKNYQDYLMNKALLGVIICLIPDEDGSADSHKKDDNSGAAASTATTTKPIPIGVIHLSDSRLTTVQHRNSTIGVSIGRGHQSKGYGSEAIRWVLDWAFRRAGLHRVGIQCFEHNFGARKLYEKLGFKLEGRVREMFWHDGKFWDDFTFGMLEREWRETQEKQGPS